MRWFPYAAALAATACTAAFPTAELPELAAGETRWFRLDRMDAQNGIVQTSLLSVQAQQDGSTRWVQTDAFGAPQARLTVSAQGWRRDGFVMPNREAQQLFTAMFPLLRDGFGRAGGSRRPATLHTGALRWQVTPIMQP